MRKLDSWTKIDSEGGGSFLGNPFVHYFNDVYKDWTTSLYASLATNF
jgi:hypothetical protein